MSHHANKAAVWAFCWLVAAAGVPPPSAGAADPADREFAYAEALSRRGLDSLAVAVMERFAKDRRDHARYEEALFLRAGYLQKAGDPAAALAAFEEFLEKHSYSRFKVEAMCRSAELCYDLKRWASAAERLHALLEIKEQLSADWIMRARYYLAWSRAELGQYEEALNRFRDFAALSPDSALAQEAQLAAGDCLRRLNRHEQAFAVYGRVMGEAGGEQAVAAAFGMGMACLEAKEYHRAAVAFGEVLRKGPRSPHAAEALLRRAESLTALKDLDAARGCLSQIIREFPEAPAFPQAVERLGNLLLAGRKTAPSAPSSLNDIELYGLVLAQIRAGKQIEAEAFLAGVMPKPGAGAPRAGSVWRFRACAALAAALDEAGRKADAAAWFARAWEEDPSDALAPTCLLNAAELRLNTGADAESAALLKAFLTQQATHDRAPLARWNLAQLYMKAGQYSDAAGLLETLFNSPADDQAPSLRAEAALRAGLAWALASEYEKAAAIFGQYEERFGAISVSQGAFAYADALARGDSLGRAVEVLRRLVERLSAASAKPSGGRAAPGDELAAWANYRLGVLCERAGAWEEAASAFAAADQAGAPAAVRSDALVHCGIALFRAGRPQECASGLIQTMKRYPSKVLPLAAYAWLAAECLKAGDVGRARQVCETLEAQAGRQERYRAFAQLTQARCDAYLRNWQAAADRLQRLVGGAEAALPDAARPPDGLPDAETDYAARRLLADALFETGQGPKGLSLLQEMVSRAGGRAAAEAQVVLARRLRESGRPAEAAATFRHCLLLFDARTTRDVVAASLAGLAACEEQMGRGSRARAARARLAALQTSETADGRR